MNDKNFKRHFAYEALVILGLLLLLTYLTRLWPILLLVILGIFIATLGGGSFTKFNRFLIGDILKKRIAVDQFLCVFFYAHVLPPGYSLLSRGMLS